MTTEGTFPTGRAARGVRASATEVVEVAAPGADRDAFTEAELAGPGVGRPEGRAARIAAKRAALAVAARLGARVGEGPDALRMVEVLGGSGAAPRLVAAAGLLPAGAVAHVSLAHDGGLAAATVLVESPAPHDPPSSPPDQAGPSSAATSGPTAG